MGAAVVVVVVALCSSFSQTLLTTGNDVTDDRWHVTTLRRRQRSLELRVDNDTNKVKVDLASKYGSMGQVEVGNDSLMKSRSSPRSSSSSKGNPSTDHPPPGEGFHGKMQQLIVNRNELFELLRTGTWRSAVESSASFDPYHGGLLSPIAFRSSAAFFVVRIRIYSTFAIYFQMKTFHPDGLVLYSGRPGQDFMAVELLGGQLRFAYDLGSSPRVLLVTLRHPISDNRWHEVAILRPTLKELILRVDNTSKSDVLQDLRSVYFDLEEDIYVGGAPESMLSVLHKQVRSREGFHGCLASVDLNGELLFLDEQKANIPREFHGLITEECEGSVTDCSQLSCQNGGSCVHDWNSFSCDCDMTSYTGPTCTEGGLAYRFGKRGGLITFTYSESERTDTTEDTVAFGLVTTQASAVLMRVVSGTSNDYIEIELVNGNVYVVYNMGTKDHPIGDVFKKVNDNTYHVVRFTRDGPNSSLQVDDQAIQTKHPTGQQLTAFNNQAMVYIGGKRDSSGKLQKPFHGLLAGLVLNGQQLLALSADGDSRTKIEGDVQLDNNQHPPYAGGGDKVPTRRSLRLPLTTPTPYLNSKDPRRQRNRDTDSTIASLWSNSSSYRSSWNCANPGCGGMTSSFTQLAAFSSAPPTPTPSLTSSSSDWQISGNAGLPVISKRNLSSPVVATDNNNNNRPQTTTDPSTTSTTTRVPDDHRFRPSYQSHIDSSSREINTHPLPIEGILLSPSMPARGPDPTHPVDEDEPLGSTSPPAAAPISRTSTGGRASSKRSSFSADDRSSGGAGGVNVGLAAGTVIGALVLLLLILYAAFKYRSRDEGTYKIDEGTGYGYDGARTAKPLVHLNGKARCQDVPGRGSREWYV